MAFDGNTGTKWENGSVGTSNKIWLTLTGCGTVTCTPPAAPSLSASVNNVVAGTAVQLSASGCSGTVTWSDGQSGNHTVNPSQTTTYTATCTVNGCTSSTANITVTVIPVSSGVNCNTVQGHFDIADCNTMSGWAYDSSNPNNTVTLELYEGSTTLVGNISANLFRSDLPGAGIGNGYHAFSFSSPTSLKNGQQHTIGIRVSGCSYELNNSPKFFTCSSGARIGIENDKSIDVQGLESEEGGLKLSVYPNPTSSEVQASFYLEKGRRATVFVYDVKGSVYYKRVFEGKGVHKEKIVIPSNVSGTAVIVLDKGTTKETKKLIIIK